MKQVSWAEEIAATPEQVWAVLANPERMPHWLAKDGPYPYVVKVEGEAGEGATWEVWAVDEQKATYSVQRYEPGQLLACEQVRQTGPLPVWQRHTFGLDVTEQGTLVSWFVDYELLFEDWKQRVIIGWDMADDIEEHMAVSLQNLKNVVEADLKPEE